MGQDLLGSGVNSQTLLMKDVGIKPMHTHGQFFVPELTVLMKMELFEFNYF